MCLAYIYNIIELKKEWKIFKLDVIWLIHWLQLKFQRNDRRVRESELIIHVFVIEVWFEDKMFCQI